MVVRALNVLGIFLWSVCSVAGGDLREIPSLGIRLDSDFDAILHADSDLANDTYAMTLDSKGRVVVSTQGSIKTLHDSNHDGQADSAQLFSRTATGAMGLCSDGNQLFYFADNGLWRIEDKNEDGMADSPPERLMAVKFREHGGHAMRRGPDGFWYFVAGNESELTARHVTAPLSPVTDPVAGAIFRITPDGRRAQIIAHGFRNQYDFDFNWRGAIFTYDSDVERDYLLPWYTPTRLYHVAYGGHHGWQLDGWLRSWNRPDYYLDTVDIMQEMGRGSPTGVTSYRHTQFPQNYRDGLFIADWTFGRIFFCPVESNGSTYRTAPRLFLEPLGTQGFAPTDLAVGPDGSLFISIGGRKTRGAVFKITHKSFQPKKWPEMQAEFGKKGNLDQILDAPQPLDAWSRAHWMPLARKLPVKRLITAVTEEGRTEHQKVRALEIISELFGPLSREDAAQIANSPSAPVRERLAWMVARAFPQNGKNILMKLAADADPAVRVAALNSIQETVRNFTWSDLKAPFTSCMEHPDKRVRQGTAQVLAQLPLREWNDAIDEMKGLPTQSFLTTYLAGTWRKDQNRDELIKNILDAVQNSNDPELNLQAARLLMICLGDWELFHPTMEGYTAYELFGPRESIQKHRQKVLAFAHGRLPSTHQELNQELARLLAMLSDESSEGPVKLHGLLRQETDPTAQFHYLTALSRLAGRWSPELVQTVTGVVLGFDEKLKGKENRPKQNWNVRLNEILGRLIKANPALERAMVEDPTFVASEHVLLTQVLSRDTQRMAAEKFFQKSKETGYPWSPQMVVLLSLLPLEQVRPFFYQHWNEFGIRENIALALSKAPVAEDKPYLLEAMALGHPSLIRTCLAALDQINAQLTPPELARVVEVLLQSIKDSPDMATRQAAVKLLEGERGAGFDIPTEGKNINLRQWYQPVFQWFSNSYPDQWAAIEKPDKRLSDWTSRWKEVPWKGGRVAEGKAIYQQRACASCHGNGSAIGPDLKGAALRFSVEDLFTAIIWPGKDVAPNYRPWTFQMQDGQSYSGFISFESADGVIIQTAGATTVRLPDQEIISRKLSHASLMPDGLLDGLDNQALADLYAYLQGL